MSFDLPKEADEVLEFGAGSEEWYTELSQATPEVVLQFVRESVEERSSSGNKHTIQPLLKPNELRLDHPPVGKLEKAEGVIDKPCHHGPQGGRYPPDRHDLGIGQAARPRAYRAVVRAPE